MRGSCVEEERGCTLASASEPAYGGEMEGSELAKRAGDPLVGGGQSRLSA